MKKLSEINLAKSSEVQNWHMFGISLIVMLLLFCWGCDSEEHAPKQPKSPLAVKETPRKIETAPAPKLSVTNKPQTFEKAYEEAMKRLRLSITKRDRDAWHGTGPYAGVRGVRGARGWTTMRYPLLVEESSTLAKRLTDQDIVFLQNRLLRNKSAMFAYGGPFFSADARLAILTIAKSIHQDRAAEVLGELIEKNIRLGVYGLSLLPAEKSIPQLKKITKQRHSGVRTSSYVRSESVALLTIMGGQTEHRFLKALLDKGYSFEPLVYGSYQDCFKRFEKRLAISDSDKQKAACQAELVYWQCYVDIPPMRSYVDISLMRVRIAGIFHAASRHRYHGIIHSTELLRERFPEPYAIATIAIQKEKTLVPELKALAEKNESKKRIVKRALFVIDQIGVNDGQDNNRSNKQEENER